MTKKLLRKRRASSLSRAPFVRRDADEMNKIINEIHSGIITIRAACFKYGLCRNTLKLWISKSSIRKLEPVMRKKHFTPIEEGPDSKELQRKVYELTRALELAKLKISGLETMIKLSEEDFQIKIRKKSGTKRSKE